MKIKLNNPFQTLALLMAMLIFSTPFVIYAQQNTLMLEAKADAKKARSIRTKATAEGISLHGCLAVFGLAMVAITQGD